MKSVSAREANQKFSSLLSEVEQGEEIVVTRQGNPVAVLRPFTQPETMPDRRKAVARLHEMLDRGLPWPEDFEMPSREEMHDRPARDR